MEYEYDEGMFAIIYEVRDEYVWYRRKGMSRTEAIQEVKEYYAGELEDEETAVFIHIGIAFALCKKKELTREALTDAIAAMDTLGEMCNNRSANLKKLRQQICDEQMLGDEARYPKKRKPYIPDWKIGDVFAHEITIPTAEKLGILGWYVLIWKVGEFEGYREERMQLVYMTVCPPDKLPKNADELFSLGFLRMIPGHGIDFRAHIQVKNKKDEEAFDLTKIGNFPSIKEPPAQPELTNLNYTTPLFNFKTKFDYGRPEYEATACMQYRQYGIFKF